MARLILVFGLMAAAVALAQQGPAPAAPPELPLEYFTRHDEFGTVKISPDGEYIAVTTGKYGRGLLSFIALDGMKLVSQVRAPDPYEIYDFYWASPQRVIYTIAQRYAGDRFTTPTGEMFGINRDGSRHGLIYGWRAEEQATGKIIKGRKATYATAKLISSLENDDDEILVAEHPWREFADRWRYDPDAKPRIMRLNVYSGKKRLLDGAPLRNAILLVDSEDNVRFAVGLNDEFRMAASWKPEPNAPWRAFELPGFRDDGVAPLLFTADGRSIIFIGVRTGESVSALYRLELETQAIEKIHGFDGVGVENIITDFEGRELIGVTAHLDRPVTHWIVEDAPAVRVYQALERAFPGQSVSVTSATADGRKAIVFVYSDTNPGDFYLFDVTSMKADFLRAARQWIDPKQMRPRESIEIVARDGLRLHGYLTRPAGEGPHPLIVLPHGGPHGVRDYWGFDPEVQLFANRGYAVLQVNYRGSGGYGIDFQEAGYRQWGAKMQDDLTDATRWAIEQGVAHADRICIYGASYGGYAALMGAAREPTLYRCAIGHAGIYDLELMLSSADVPNSRAGRAYLHTVLGDDPADLRARSPVHLASRIQAPVLLIHGKDDWRADYEQARRMKAALEAHDKQVEWMALSGEGHGVYQEDARREVYERILGFLAKHLRAQGE